VRKYFFFLRGRENKFLNISILYLYIFYSCEYYVFIYFCFSHVCVYGEKAEIWLSVVNGTCENRAKSHKKRSNSILGGNPSKVG